MDKKTVAFICTLIAVTLVLSSWTIMENRSEANVKESKLEPAIINFIEIFNNVDKSEYKTLYWEAISQGSKDKLIQQTGSADLAQREVWIMLQKVVDAQRQVEYLGLDHMEIEGNVATVLIRVRITEAGEEPLETTSLHKYRWENNEWKFVDWLVEPEAYSGVGT
jgi:arginine decarboxylase-like protein